MHSWIGLLVLFILYFPVLKLFIHDLGDLFFYFLFFSFPFFFGSNGHIYASHPLHSVDDYKIVSCTYFLALWNCQNLSSSFSLYYHLIKGLISFDWPYYLCIAFTSYQYWYMTYSMFINLLFLLCFSSFFFHFFFHIYQFLSQQVNFHL